MIGPDVIDDIRHYPHFSMSDVGQSGFNIVPREAGVTAFPPARESLVAESILKTMESNAQSYGIVLGRPHKLSGTPVIGRRHPGMLSIIAGNEMERYQNRHLNLRVMPVVQLSTLSLDLIEVRLLKIICILVRSGNLFCFSILDLQFSSQGIGEVKMNILLHRIPSFD